MMYVIRPTSPCTPDCERRSTVCHNPDACTKWEKYEREMRAYRQARTAAMKEQNDIIGYKGSVCDRLGSIERYHHVSGRRHV